VKTGVSIHDRIKEKAASGIRRGGLRGDDCLGVRIFDRVVGGKMRGGVFPNQALGGRQTGGHRKLVDPVSDVRLRERGEGAHDLTRLAVWALLLYLDTEGGISFGCRIAEVDI
jgi:hypothetical protein